MKNRREEDCAGLAAEREVKKGDISLTLHPAIGGMAELVRLGE